MHVTISLLYGVTLWLILLTYVALTGASVLTALFSAPFVVSGGAAFLMGLDALIHRLRKLWI